MNNSLVVYTMAIGSHFVLPKVNKHKNVDYICFTDQEEIEANGWMIQKLELTLPGDVVRSSRDIKIRPHRWLKNYHRSIYHDSSVKLLVEPDLVWELLMPNENVEFGGLYHSFRNSVAEEFSAVAKGNLDYKVILREQEQHYKKFFPEILTKKPVFGGLIARRHNNSACSNAMEIWFCNVLRYSRRDQLSLPVALKSLKITQKKIIASDVRNSDFFVWPHAKVAPKPDDYTVKNSVRMILSRWVRREMDIFKTL